MLLCGLSELRLQGIELGLLHHFQHIRVKILVVHVCLPFIIVSSWDFLVKLFCSDPSLIKVRVNMIIVDLLFLLILVIVLCVILNTPPSTFDGSLGVLLFRLLVGRLSAWLFLMRLLEVLPSQNIKLIILNQFIMFLLQDLLILPRWILIRVTLPLNQVLDLPTGCLLFIQDALSDAR